MYNRNQLFGITVVLCFFIFSTIHYFRYKYLEEKRNLKKVTILNTSCSATPRGASSINVSFNNKEYYLQLPYERCYKYASGDKIDLLYDFKYDQFYLLDFFNVYKNRFLFTALILFVSLIPYKYLRGLKFKN